MKLTEYDYNLPEEFIAQEPVSPRDSSKLMVLNKEKETIEHKHFYDIIDYLKKGDLLVMNSTKVIPARLMGRKKTGGFAEIFLLNRIDINNWECLVRPGRRLKEGTKVYFGKNKLIATIIKRKENGNRVVAFEYDGIFEEILDELGEMPLPPYIKAELKEKDRYQTVYAQKGESVAAPTAGLHFTQELLTKIKEKGVEIAEVFLEVGLGTFRPVKTENVLEHQMHEEKYEVPVDAAEKINRAKREGRRVIAVGTTSVRTLESASEKKNEIIAKKESTDIFIYPGYEFKIVDAIITNFHLPKSTLIMLISAFAKKDFIFEAYEKAIKDKYRFFSFGDAMFIY
ncbi:MAG: tRNA preQ1(34) S-adenosylmethionine ribosyltransferase-isomerase QueA [Fusobacteriia bacterium 4572_132]|nr:MAG: tRNA preQ1(34) S-adenosylmethionine ribosyltransferase-isomerase QueA [Fusobacteriia bacterium 4572_132]